MNDTGPCNKMRGREKSAIELKGGRDLHSSSQERVLRKNRLVVVVFYELNKRRGISG